MNAKAKRVEVKFVVGQLAIVLRWVLSFASQAKVRRPPELLRMISEEVDAMSAD